MAYVRSKMATQTMAERLQLRTEIHAEREREEDENQAAWQAEEADRAAEEERYT